MISGGGEAADCFLARWHWGEAERSWLHHAAEDAKSGGKGSGEEKGARTDTSVDKLKKRHGRLCGRVAARLMNVACVTI